MKDKKKGGLWIAMGLLLIAAAIGLCAYNLYDARRAESVSNDSVQHLQAEIAPKQENVKQKQHDPGDSDSVTKSFSETELAPSQIEIPDYVLDPTMEMPATDYEGHEYIGILHIPELTIELPVMSDWSYPQLRIAPCRYDGTAYEGNFVICAHNYDAHFGRLNELDEGDRIYFTDVDGNEFGYHVILKETLQPTDIEGMVSDDWDLTLFTCTRGGSYRVTVRCLRAE